MRIAHIDYNDVANTESGMTLSVWFQGCPHKCPGCHNPETWDFLGGEEYTTEQLLDEVSEHLWDNGIKRSLSLLGGEPLAEPNREAAAKLCFYIKRFFPSTIIYVWTGYEMDELIAMEDENIDTIIKYCNVLCTGRFELDKRDITLPLVGSTNQRVLYKGKDF
mgnify:CR=1 FL=1